MLVVCSLLAMIFVLLHCHPATKKLCPHAEVMLAFRDHGIITTSSNKTLYESACACSKGNNLRHSIDVVNT